MKNFTSKIETKIDNFFDWLNENSEDKKEERLKYILVYGIFFGLAVLLSIVVGS